MFKKIFGYFKYRKIIDENIDILNKRYKLRYDKLYGRLFTIVSIPERRQEVLRDYKIPGNIQNPKETDVNSYLDAEVRNYIASLEEYLYSIGLFELTSISKIDSVDDVNVLLVFRYKYNNHRKFLYTIIGILLGVPALAISTAFVTGVVKLILLIINFIIAL